MVFQKITNTFEHVCCSVRNVKSNYLKCISSQCLSPPCVLFILFIHLFIHFYCFVFIIHYSSWRYGVVGSSVAIDIHDFLGCGHRRCCYSFLSTLEEATRSTGDKERPVKLPAHVIATTLRFQLPSLQRIYTFGLHTTTTTP